MDSAHEALCDALGLDDGRLKLENAAPHGYHFRVSRKEEKASRTAPPTPPVLSQGSGAGRRRQTGVPLISGSGAGRRKALLPC
eukprot:scaffold21664_cov51-Isochrysis_galbana.AAC.1